jgi:hypothetical protein
MHPHHHQLPIAAMIVSTSGRTKHVALLLRLVPLHMQASQVSSSRNVSVKHSANAARLDATCTLAIQGASVGPPYVRLNCSSSTGENVILGYNRTNISKYQWQTHGVTLAEGLPCQERAGKGKNSTGHQVLPHYSLLFFCGDYDLRILHATIEGVRLGPAVVAFNWDNVPGVWMWKNSLLQRHELPTEAMQPFTTALLSFGGRVRASFDHGLLLSNEASNAILATDHAIVTILNMRVHQGPDWYCAGVRANSFAEVHVSYSELKGLHTPGDGGGVLVEDAALLTISNSVIEDTSSVGVGGCLAIKGASTVHVSHSAITGCTARTSAGGGVHADGSSKLSITNSSITNSACSPDMGRPHQSMDACSGGCVATHQNASLHATKVSFWNCFATGEGGALYVAGATATLVNSSIGSSDCWLRGGGLAVMSTAKTHVIGSNFSACTSELAGGGVYVNGTSSLEFVNSQIEDSGSDGAGGCMCAHGSSITHLAGCTFRRCSAAGAGGGLCLSDDATVTANKSWFLESTTRWNGGGIAVLGSAQLTLNDSAILSCNASCGGALYAQGASVLGQYVACNVAMHLVIVRNNSADIGGGLCAADGTDVYGARSAVLITNGYFSDNAARNGAGSGLDIFASTSAAITLINSNIQPTSMSVVVPRECRKGETRKSGTCQLCEPSTFSLDVSTTACQPCHAYANCSLGGAAMVPVSGFWHGGNETNQPTCWLGNIIR